jgi:hypothetical protein
VAELNQSETRHVTRRRLLTAATGMLAGLFANQLWIRSARAQTDDVCYWKTVQGPICSGGRLREYRCYICCAGGECITEGCWWFDLGPC